MKKNEKKYSEQELIIQNNPAKSLAGSSKKKKHKRKRKRDNKVSRGIGIALAIIQLIASIVLMGSLFVLDMLSMKYLAIIGAVLLVLFLITLFGQLASKKKAIFGKLFSIVLSAVFIFVAYYVFKANSTVETITNAENKKIDTIVVAVMDTDPAESIEDAVDYNFGVQYTLKGEEIAATVEVINEEFGKDIATVDCGSVLEQAVALQNGQVDAIIYNEAYAGIMDEEMEDFDDSLKIIYTYEIESEADLIIKNEPEEEDNTFSVYISGIDVYGKIGKTSRSDVNIMAVVNTETHQILLVTTPRDYYVPIPGISGGVRDKLTHAGIYGINASMDTLSELYNTDIDYYARVNFTSLITMVDALGGITVYSDQEFSGMSNLHVVEGYNELNGEQALAFARERYNVEGGDFQRGRNQQEVIKGMIRKAISPAILTGANEILESVSGNIDMNIPSEMIRELIKQQLDTGASWNIKTMSASGTGDKQTCYSIPSMNVYVAWPNEDSVKEIQDAIKAVENGETLEGSDVIQ